MKSRSISAILFALCLCLLLTSVAAASPGFDHAPCRGVAYEIKASNYMQR